MRAPPQRVEPYGDHPDQVANLHAPLREPPWPVVVLVHGGFWRARFDRTLMTPLAQDLARSGYAAWNIEYRRVGQAGGGWPGTLEDVAAAVDALSGVAEVDSAHVVVVGHSAGGHLALWLAARDRLTHGAVGSAPRVHVRAAVGQAPVADLQRAARERLGQGAVEDFMGGSARAVPDRYAVASPAALLPLGLPQLLIHGTGDAAVPIELSRSYAAQAEAAGDRVELLEVPAADHFDVIDPDHDAWAAVTARLPTLLSIPPPR